MPAFESPQGYRIQKNRLRIILSGFFNVIRFDNRPELDVLDNILLISLGLGLLRGIIYRSFIDWVVYLIEKYD